MIIGFGGYLKDYLEHYNISQVEFADRLDISTKHLNEILNKNIDMSNELMVAISIITDIDINFIVKIENNKKIKQYLINKYGDNLKEYLKKFNIKELDKKKWVNFKHIDDEYQNAIDILKFLKVRNFEGMNNILNNILYKKKEDSDETKLLLWITRCNEIANNQTIEEFKPENFNKIITFLKEESNNRFNYAKIQKEFNKNGFYFVIEDALPGTKVRGCSKVRKDKPTIYLTKLYNDKASIYFALYHELGHLKHSYNKAKNKYIIDSDEDLEKQADEFAINQMIDKKSWNEIISSNNIIETSKKISKEKNIPMSFIVRILAYNKYIKYNDNFYNEYIEKIDYEK